MDLLRRLALFLVIVLPAGNCAHAGTDEATNIPSIIGIDHMPTAVEQLELASDDYRKLGFALKPGRAHENGIRNIHVKFEDGAGIELISPPAAASDTLTKHYADFLKDGEGPAYIALYARDTNALVTALRSSGLKLRSEGDGTELDEPLLDFLFFVQDNRSPSDRPEHFAHPNSATAMTGVWLALDDAHRRRVRQLLLALGATVRRESVLAPERIEADVFAVRNGRIVVLPASHQTHAGRPIIGVEFRVRDLASTACNPHISTKPPAATAPRRCVIAPSRTHGAWLEFHQ